jgi:hypothetical protein
VKIRENILGILSECTIQNNIVFLPQIQLDRKIYQDVNKCLESIGGKWNRKTKGHVFDDNPVDILDNLILTGVTTDLKKEYQFFPTPRQIAEKMCDMAELNKYSHVLEPSCGKGDLMDVIHERGVYRLLGVEINRGMDRYLKDKPYTTVTGLDFITDFAEDENIRHDWTHIIMNPPFSRQQDVSHIWTSYSILEPGGTLVSIVSESPFFRTNKTSADFRAWLEEVNAELIKLPEGAFKESGTMVRARIIKVRKAG